MATVSTNIKIDEKLKKEAQELFDKLGLNLTSAVNIFLSQAVREQAIPFRVTLIPNTITTQVLQDVNSGKNLHGPFNSVEALMEDLDADN